MPSPHTFAHKPSLFRGAVKLDINYTRRECCTILLCLGMHENHDVSYSDDATAAHESAVRASYARYSLLITCLLALL